MTFALKSSAVIAVVVAVTGLAACSSGGSKHSSSSSSTSVTSGSGGAQASSHRGGTMTILQTDNPGTADPAIDYGPTWLEENMTYDGLLAFRKVAGAAGNELVPDLATAIPKPTDGGRTFTFHLRPNIRYSNGATVKASDFTNVFERMFKVHGPTSGSFYTVIAGGRACGAKPTSCDLSKGVVANDKAGTVTFHLVRADGEFLDKLALPFAFAIPPTTPNTDTGTNPPPGTGAYKWAQYTPNRQIKLARNPHFKQWSSDAQPDGHPDVILIKIGVPTEAEITQVENDQADAVIAPQFPPDRLPEMSTKYAAQTHINLQTGINYVSLNTRVAPFDNVQVRRAVNYATDRAALVKIYGGSNLAVPTCQVLPPNFPGYKPYCPYSKGGGGTTWKAPDLAKARQLVAASGTKGQKVTIVMPTFPIGQSVGLYFVGLLEKLGFRATLKQLEPAVAGPFAANSRNKVQMTLNSWSQDYPAASDFINVLTSCHGFSPDTDANTNLAEFCNQAIQNQIDKALVIGVTDPTRANVLWAQIDREVTDQAPLVVMNNPKQVTFVSKRVGNFEYNPLWYWLPDQSWVK